MSRPSDDRALGTDSAVVDIAEIEYRPDLMIRWDDETVLPDTTGSIECSRVPSRRARCTSSPTSRPTTPQLPQR